VKANTIDTGQRARDQGTAPHQSVDFYIPATTSILERRPRTLKHGNTFGVFDHYGNAISGKGSPEGLFHRDTRYLSELRILIDGRRPLLLSSTVLDNNALLSVDLTNPNFMVGDAVELPRDTLHIVRSKFLWEAACHERVGIKNFGSNEQLIELTFQFAADFADIFEVRGHVRAHRGETQVDVDVDTGAVTFSYAGLDGIVRRTVIGFEPCPDHIDHESAIFRLALPPRGRASVFSTVSCKEGTEPEKDTPGRFFVCFRAARRALRESTARAASVETSNEIFNEVLCRSMADLHMLMTETEHGPYPYAGIPWFSTAFGRDAIIAAIELLWIDPTIAKGVLKYLAANQAVDKRPEADAEPGKILHETRLGEMARLGEVPFARYYGSVDSTPLFVVLAGYYFERTGDLETILNLWPNIESALAWIDKHGDRDGDGFVEPCRAGATGSVNQGWKDSARRCPTPMARSQKVPSLYAKCKPMCLLRNGMPLPSLAPSVFLLVQRSCNARLNSSGSVWRPRSGVIRSALTFWPLMAARSPARSVRRTPAIFCSPVSHRANGPSVSLTSS
jgi:glycogen debranching enzyme